jgi:serine O-acetyltransferase
MRVQTISFSSLSYVSPSPGVAAVWEALNIEASDAALKDPVLTRAMNSAILFHASFAQALAQQIAFKLANHDLDQDELLSVIAQVFSNNQSVVEHAADDLKAIKERDPSNADILTPFLYFKGFVALQGQRVANWLWNHDRLHLARHIQSRISEVFGVDIHPAARMGKSIMLDHGSGLVIGETAVVEDDVSILQNVTLGGTGKERGDRHPKVRRGALIGAGAKILGNIEIGVGAKVGAGSVVVNAVAPYTSVAGIPAKPIGRPHSTLPGITMDQILSEPEYII